jgi:iron complex outermembrane receptor protein
VPVAALPALLALALPARAGTVVDPFQEPDEADAFAVEEQMVTVASRYAQTARQAPSIVTVLTDREIRERGFLTLSDLLSSVSGVYTTMAPEGRSLAWFRGVISPDDNKFLLLVDGLPWYDGVYTHAWIDEYLPLENVRQVEII